MCVGAEEATADTGSNGPADQVASMPQWVELQLQLA